MLKTIIAKPGEGMSVKQMKAEIKTTLRRQPRTVKYLRDRFIALKTGY